MIPSISRDNADFPRQRYWKGAVWPPLNFIVYLGLRKYGFDSVGRELARTSDSMLLRGWDEHGIVSENYSAITGTGDDPRLSSDPFHSWGALMGIMSMVQSGAMPPPEAPLRSMTEPHNAPPWQMRAVESLAGELYGLRARARRLPSEYDQVFHLVTPDGTAFIMKVMHPCREAGFIDLQCRTLQHLARTAPACNLPRVINTNNGEAFTSVRGDDGEERLVWLLSYLPGKVLFEARPHSPELFERIGELLGAVDQSLRDFTHPAARRDLKWDLSQALWIRDRLQVIEDPEQRALIAHVISFTNPTSCRIASLRKTVIYGDGNDYNVLVQWAAGDANRSVGLIDFGDMHEGLTVAEPAVALLTPSWARKIRYRPPRRSSPATTV